MQGPRCRTSHSLFHCSKIQRESLPRLHGKSDLAASSFCLEVSYKFKLTHYPRPAPQEKFATASESTYEVSRSSKPGRSVARQPLARVRKAKLHILHWTPACIGIAKTQPR